MPASPKSKTGLNSTSPKASVESSASIQNVEVGDTKSYIIKLLKETNILQECLKGQEFKSMLKEGDVLEECLKTKKFRYPDISMMEIADSVVES